MGLSDSDIGLFGEQQWRRGRQVIDEISRHGFQCHLDSLPYAGGALKLRDRSIRCIDGRVPGGGVRLAGSGVHLGLEGAKQFAEAAGATGVTYHRDCNAAALYAESHGLPEDQAANCGHDFAKRLADSLGLPCTEARIDGPPEFHDELVIYYDGTGRFDPSGCRFLPRGFVISRAYLDFRPKHAGWEVQLAISLALGERGFCDRFTPETPLTIVALGDASTDLSALRREIEHIPGPYGGRVRIDSVVVEP